jgi:hypothetical protein
MTEETRESGAGWSAPDRPGLGIPPPPPPPPPQRITLPPGIQAPRPPGHTWPGPATARLPSGLFPSGPPRPTYREPHPTRLGAVALGGAAATVWMALFGLLAGTARAYAWWTVAAGVVAWLCALALARFGLRGVAVGIALTSGLAIALAGVIVMEHWIGGHWVLW